MSKAEFARSQSDDRCESRRRSLSTANLWSKFSRSARLARVKPFKNVTGAAAVETLEM